MSTTTSDSHFAWTYFTDTLGAFAAVWALGLAVLLIGLPIALVLSLALRLGRMVFPGL